MGLIKSLIAWIKKASRENRMFRTYIQASVGYLLVNAGAVLNDGGDLALALETLAAGSIAAGLSALWKTAQEIQGSSTNETA